MTRPSGRPGNAISCFVADDHPPVRQFVTSFLAERGFQIAGSAGDGVEALRRILELAPHVAILDARMPGLSGTDVARELTRNHAPTRSILYTGCGDQALLLHALDAGAAGFVQKEAPLDDLVEAVRCVAAGDSYVDPVLGGVLLQRRAFDSLPELTSRQRDVLRLLADGLGDDEVGRRLFVSPETVRAHLHKAMATLEASTRTQAVARAIRQSLIE